MKKIHLVVCDLFLPGDIAPGICADLRLPALEKMLARGVLTGQAPSTGSGQTGDGDCLENHLCELFGVPCQGNAPIAPISAAFDGLGEGCWLRADPVHLRLQRDQLVLLPDVEISAGEAGQLCAALNEHFAGQGMEFFAPHPQRWYVRLEQLPDIETVPLSQAAGSNVRGLLPKGKDAAYWHRIINEIQMLLFAHPVSEAREARGELPVNSLWLWGGGCDTLLAKPADCGSRRQAALPAPEGSVSPCQGGGCGVNMPPQRIYDHVCSDEVLAEMLSAAAGVPFSSWAEQWDGSPTLALVEQLAIRPGCQDTAAKSLVISRREREFSLEGRQLLVWTGLRSALRRGDLDAWRTALQEFEAGYARPLWNALRAGKISQLQMDILGGDRVRRLSLTRTDAWIFWRNVKPLDRYSMV